MQFSAGTGRITGVGSALVDILLRESDSFVAETGAAKGGMTLVDAAVIESLLAKATGTPAVVPGGSACNTILGVGRLGAPARFIGRRGDDSFGENFEKALRAGGVEPLLGVGATPTGRVVSVITPDAQRTMYTNLGAAAENTAADLTAAQFAGSDIVHIEGYLVFNRDLFFAALKRAKEAGARVSLDLASFTVVEASRDIIFDAVRENIDILIANEDEAKAYTGLEDEAESLAVLARDAKIAVLKQGKRGSLIRQGDAVVQVGIEGGKAIDTTGAGDLWAAGFLHGLTRGWDLARAGRLGALCGGEVVHVIGAHIPEEGWTRIRQAAGL